MIHFPEEAGLLVRNPGSSTSQYYIPGGILSRDISIPWVFVLPSTCVSQCQGIGGPLLLWNPEGSFLQGQFLYGPEGRPGTGVGDESKGQILYCSVKSVKTEVLTPLTEHVSHLKTIPRRESLQIPFDTPDITFRSGQHGPLERDWFRAIPPYTFKIYKNCHDIPVEL